MAVIQSVSMSVDLSIIAKRYKISLSEATKEGILLLLHQKLDFPNDSIEENYYGKGIYAEFKRKVADNFVGIKKNIEVN